jgi:hypothetical protein
MGLSWSRKAEADLANIAPAIREQIKHNAEETLPDIRPGCTGQDDHGIFWHRGITHEQENDLDWRPQEDVDGTQPWDYYLYYRTANPGGFEVLAVLSTNQIANRGGHIACEPPDPDVE